MKRYIILAIALLLIVAVGYIALKIYNEEMATGIDSLNAEASSPLSTDGIKIEYGFTTLNRKEDAELFNDRERYKVFFDGVKKDSVQTVKGENDFLVTYNNEYYLSFRHLKRKSRSWHDYRFHVSQPDSVPVLNVDIGGKNEMHFEMRMIPISIVNKFICNTPLKDAGIVYDFLKAANPETPAEQKEKTEMKYPR